MIRNNMMRNKRLLKEKERMKEFEYNIQWPDNLDENVIIININKNVLLKIQDYYPFKSPKMYINNIDHIDWFLKKQNIYKILSNEMNIKIKCICCGTVECAWNLFVQKVKKENPSKSFKEVLLMASSLKKKGQMNMPMNKANGKRATGKKRR